MNTTSHEQRSTTLVTGGTGKTGRRVAARLAAMGVPVRVGSRSGRPRFDWEDPRTWDAALDGVEAAYLSYYPDLAHPAAAAAITAFTDRAVAAGVRRLVLLSGRGEPEAARCEQIVLSRAVEPAVVRAAMFNQNFTEHFLLEPVRDGLLAFPAGQVAEPFVDVEDIAEVAAAALTGRGHAGEIYEVTGPRALTFAEAVAEISAATGRAVRYLPITPQQYERGLVREAGVPADLAGFLAGLFEMIFDGRNEATSDGVQRALGRKPRDFSEFVAAAAADGAWDPR